MQDAIQVFNQSPRQWRPTRWKNDDVAEFLELMKGADQVAPIHAVYLINPATKEEMRKKSATSLIHALRMGDEIEADGVVVHPGSTVGEPREEALPRVGEMVKHALAESDRCRLLLETPPARQHARPLLRGAARARRPGGRRQAHRHLPRLCHMFASGFDISTADKLTDVLDRGLRTVGKSRLRSLHMNDSQTKLGSNRDRHAPPGDGEIGARGCAAFLSEPALREAARPLRGPRQGREGRREGRHRPDAGAAPQRAEVT